MWIIWYETSFNRFNCALYREYVRNSHTIKSCLSARQREVSSWHLHWVWFLLAPMSGMMNTSPGPRHHGRLKFDQFSWARFGIVETFWTNIAYIPKKFIKFSKVINNELELYEFLVIWANGIIQKIIKLLYYLCLKRF